MDDEKSRVKEAHGFLGKISQDPIRWILMAGTGLGDSFQNLQTRRELDYREIPHFPVSTVDGHAGRLILGTLGDIPVAVMLGRFHLYEGYSPNQVVFPIRVLRLLGADSLMITNASGGLDPDFSEGDIMVIRDHINLTGENPLVGLNVDAWGLRFPDMVDAYDPFLAREAVAAGRQGKLPVREGVYAGLKGPSLETPAEMRYLRTIGAHAVGFSTVQEVIAARHLGMRVLGLSVITNVCNPDQPEPATVETVIDVARNTSPWLSTLIEKVVMNDHV
jgi:purine-nucleoside phosphorylase